MPVSYIDRYRVSPEDWEAAERWAIAHAKRLGLLCEKKISAITVYSSEELWVGGEGEDMTLNPDVLTLEFDLGSHWREPYLRRIDFDPGYGADSLPIGGAAWKVSETSGDPPESLEELIERNGGSNPLLRKRAEAFPAFFELYAGVYGRLFPQVEHADLHTDLGGYDEAKASPSHMRKELWRTDLLTRLQGLRFPPMEIELAGQGHEGVIATWQPGGHVNYQIWFNLYVGEDPKVCVYCDPTQSGSTTGWLSTRLIKNEEALNKLPYTLEQWAHEDLRKKRSPEYNRWRKSVAELLRHHLPRDLEEAWAAIRRQIIHVPHEELHGDTGGYDESRLTEAREDYSSADFEKVQQWAATTGGAVIAEVDEYDWGTNYKIWLNRDGKVGGKISVPGKGGRKYVFHWELVIDFEVPGKEGRAYRQGLAPGGVHYVAYVMHNGNSVGVAYGPHDSKDFLPTLNDVRQKLGSYSPTGSISPKSKLFLYGNTAYNGAVKKTDKFFFQKMAALYTDLVDLINPIPEHEELHGDVSGYDESLMRGLTEKLTPDNWVPFTPEEILGLKRGEEVLVNYHGRAYPAKWRGWYRSDLGGSGRGETYAKVIQPVSAEVLSDPMWDPKETESEHLYPIRDVGKEVSVEHEELHTDTSSYDEAFLAALPERFRLKG
jgi:hypothetical protein